MEYTVNKLAELSGVTTRTLRYYDEIGLLKPARISSSGYRIYGRNEVKRLQQILFFRALDIQLDDIREILTTPTFDEVVALKNHREALLEKRHHLDQLISTVEKTIEETEGRLIMSDKERFEGLKKKMIKENDEKYGEEVKTKYGEKTYAESREKFANMTQEEFDHANQLATDIIRLVLLGMDEGDATGKTAMEAASKHKEWLMLYWPTYSPEAHAGLGDMYVADERFKKYYDQHREGAAEFLRDAIYHFVSK